MKKTEQWSPLGPSSVRGTPSRSQACAVSPVKMHPGCFETTLRGTGRMGENMEQMFHKLNLRTVIL